MIKNPSPILFLAGLFIILGISIKYLKCYWLIAGYNTEESRRNIDIEGLSKFLGNLFFIIAGVMGVGYILNLWGYNISPYRLICLMMPILGFGIIKAQKYDNNPKDSTEKILIIGMFVILSAIMIAPALIGPNETKIVIEESNIKIVDTFGIQLKIEDIAEIELKEEMPVILRKINGLDTSNSMKGKFELDGIGEANIYITHNNPPYIYIFTQNNTIIVNYKKSETTNEIYQMIKDSISKEKM